MGVAWFAHVVSVFAVLLAVHEALGRGNGILTGLFLGMAFLSRQLTLFFALFFIIALWTHTKRTSIKKKLFHAGGFLGALGACVLIYLAYNYIRFGNIFDTGYTYLQLGGFMNTRTEKYGQFSIFHIPFNFVYMFLQGFHINYGDWPDWFTSVHEYWPVDPFGTAITFASPFVFYAAWARWKKGLLISSWISIAIICLGTLMYYNNGWVQYNTQRFSLDFFPLLIVIIALGIQKGKKPFWKGLILFAVVMNALTMLMIPPAG
jgi:4-amino-4-deoxy-L-arabinose transferase-like glycosyltransferase